MKKIDEIMTDLGFDKKATEDTARAFIKNLIKAANDQNPPSNIQQAAVKRLDVHIHKNDLKKRINELKKIQDSESQMSFDLKIS